MLQADQLACARGDRLLFEPVSFTLAAGQWLHVQGENGVGKTSLLRLLAGLTQPASGHIRWRGESIHQHPGCYRQDRLHLGHQAALKDDLSALENLQFNAHLDGAALPLADALSALHTVGLRAREHLPVRSLSAGQRRRAMLARLLTRRAALWILDEPFTALDTAAIALLAGIVDRHVRGGGLAVLTSHQPIPVEGGQALWLQPLPARAAARTVGA